MTKKQDLKRAASRSQNVVEMFKRKKLSLIQSSLESGNAGPSREDVISQQPVPVNESPSREGVISPSSVPKGASSSRQQVFSPPSSSSSTNVNLSRSTTPSSLKRKFGVSPPIDDAPNQPMNFSFPGRNFGKQVIVRRKFNKDWFGKFSWLHYDESSDRAFCHTCIRAYNQECFTTANDTIKPSFITTGYTNWKDALVRKRGFPLHEKSDCHKHAVMCAVTIPETTADVGELLNEVHAGEKAVARQSLLKILSNVRFLARQALPLRGDGPGEPNLNFNQLYRLRGEDNPFLLEWKDRKGSNYTSHDTQDEMLKVMALQVLREIAREIRSAEFYSIMVDETSDVSNIEQLVMCIR